MSLPNSLMLNRMTNATTGDQVDDAVSALETALCDINGIPINTSIANAGFLWDATGLNKVILQNGSVDPAAAGELVRNNNSLRYYDVGVRRVPMSITGGGGTTVFNTAVVTNLYLSTIPANYMDVDGILQGHVDTYVNSILNGASLTYRFVFGNTLLTTPILNNNTGITQTNFGVKFDFRISNRGLTNSQAYAITAGIGAEANGLIWGGVTFAWTLHRVVLSSEDTTQAKAVQIDVQWSGADVSNSVSGVGFELHKLR